MKERESYDQELLRKIANYKDWPGIENTDLIIQLMRLVNKQFDKRSIEGVLASVLIYQQIIEEYLINLMKMSHLYVKGEIWPSRINFPIKKKMMFGDILDSHKLTIDFDKKNVLLEKCREFNEIRIKFVHKLFQFDTTQELIKASENLQKKFREIGYLFWEGRSYLEWQLSDLNNRVDWEQLIEFDDETE